jgi:integrase
MVYLKRLNVGNGEKLASTAAEYERDIKKFFRLMFNKDLSEITIPDLFVMRKDVEEYQTFLVNHGHKSSTINRNIATMRALYKFFEENSMKYRFKDGDETVYIKASAWNVEQVEMNDSESIGMYVHEEVVQMIELAKELPNGEAKSLAIEFASVTSFRIDAVVNIKFSDFRKEGDTWVVKAIDKKKVHEKSIRTDLYERLLKLKTPEDNRVFHMTSKTLERAVSALNEKLGLDDDRNLSFHSLKKYGIGEVYMITGGDRLATAAQGNHSSFETAEKYYLLFSKNYATMPSLLIGQEINTAPLEELSKEELLVLIKFSSRSIQYELTSKIKNKSR